MRTGGNGHSGQGSKEAVQRSKMGKRRDDFPALLMIFLFSVALTTFSALTLPQDDLQMPEKHREFFTDSEPVRKNRRATSEQSEDDDAYHIVFSTSCSKFQDWQSYVFFYFAWKVKQPGQITRIASGCEPEKEAELREFHEKYVAPFSDRFHLHFTPDYSMISGRPIFKYYNKPFGVRHWMENVMGFPDNHANDDAILMILDPDMYLFKPFTNDFTGKKMWKGVADNTTRVEHGKPFAAKYGFNDKWAKHNISYVAGPDSPAVRVKGTNEATDSYSIGPPYLATGKDMYNIVVHWTKFTPRVHDIYTDFLGEMYGYCQAAAHLELPHTMATSFMISDVVNPKEEGWDFIQDMGRDEVCEPADVNKLPFVFHYCQRYALGRWFVGKYKLPEDFFFNCRTPLLRVPPKDIAVKYNYYIFPNGERNEYRSETSIKQHGFMNCVLIDAFNEVAEYFKRNHCTDEPPNLEKTLIFHNESQFAELEGPLNAR